MPRHRPLLATVAALTVAVATFLPARPASAADGCVAAGSDYTCTFTLVTGPVIKVVIGLTTDEVKTIKDGLTGNVYYPGFANELALLAGSADGIAALLETLASLEQQHKAFRAALDTEVAKWPMPGTTSAASAMPVKTTTARTRPGSA